VSLDAKVVGKQPPSFTYSSHRRWHSLSPSPSSDPETGCVSETKPEDELFNPQDTAFPELSLPKKMGNTE